MTTIHQKFFDADYEVEMLGEKVAYSWTCEHEEPHQHTIECLWVWHDCDISLMHLDPDPNKHWTDRYGGWVMTGVGHHDLISVEPLHIEASVYWPTCCGMHGWIRDGKWIDA